MVNPVSSLFSADTSSRNYLKTTQQTSKSRGKRLWLFWKSFLFNKFHRSQLMDVLITVIDIERWEVVRTLTLKTKNGLNQMLIYYMYHIWPINNFCVILGFVWLDIAFEFRRWPLLLKPKPSHAIYYTGWLFINKSSKLDICCLELFFIIEICYKHVTSFFNWGGGQTYTIFSWQAKRIGNS